MAEELRLKQVPITDGNVTSYADTYVLSEFEVVTGNATVPNNSPILPAQTFIDDTISVYNSGIGVISSLTTYDDQIVAHFATALRFPLLTSFTANAFVEIRGSLGTGGAKFPVLTSIDGSLDVSATGLTTIAFPLLQTVHGFLMLNDNQLISVSFPELTAVSSITLSGNSLTSASFPNLTSVTDMALGAGGHLTLSNNHLTSIHFPALTTLQSIGEGPGAIELDGNNLSSAAVDALFNELAETIVTDGNAIDTSNQTPPAPPTSASSAARTYLQGKGIILVTD